jgi:hypothetical protein
VPRIALIQDGTEVARQRFADVESRFRLTCEMLSREGPDMFSVRVFTDEDVGYLLDGIERDEWQCLAFASNALLSVQVEKALTRNGDDLRRYISSGGGIVILHQQRDSLAPLLSGELLPVTAERTAKRGSTSARGADADDGLLHYPLPVDWSVLKDFREEELRATGTGDGTAAQRGDELPSFFFKTIDRKTLPSALKAVLDVPTGEVILARTDDHVTERVVISTMPLDWQFERPGQAAQSAALLANALRYATLGTPRRLVWRREQGESNPLLTRWLSLDGAAAMRTAPAEARPLDGTESWLLSAIDLFVLPEDRRDWVEQDDAVQRFLKRGGALVAAVDVSPGLTRATAVIGRYEERALATQLYAQLRAVDGWQTAQYAFELRNVVRALTFLRDLEPDGHVGEPSKLLDALLPLTDDVRKRLAASGHREDFSSSIALAETLALLRPPQKKIESDIAWLIDEGGRRAPEVALQVRSLVALIEGRNLDDFLHDAADAVGAAAKEDPSPATLVRILEAIARLGQRGLLGDEPEEAARLAELACKQLHASPWTADRGWLSVEATAHATRGLVALHTCLPSSRRELAGRLAAHIAAGATTLRNARLRYEPNAKGVAWLACVVHSIITADRVFPIGLQRLASLEWPDRVGATASTAMEHAVLQRLAVRNEELRRSERELSERLEEQLRQRLAAGIGRGTATLVPSALLVAGAVWVLFRVGWSSLGALLLSIAALSTIVLTVLGVIFVALDRWHLLAAPAPRIRTWLEEVVVPVAKTGGGIKR